MILTQENGKKPHFRSHIGEFGPPIFLFFFFKNLVPSVTRYHGQLSSSTISEKTNDPVLRKFSEGRTDRQTERQKDESDFIGRCSTNVERPKIKKNYKIKYPNIELGFSIYNTA